MSQGMDTAQHRAPGASDLSCRGRQKGKWRSGQHWVPCAHKKQLCSQPEVGLEMSRLKQGKLGPQPCQQYLALFGIPKPPSPKSFTTSSNVIDIPIISLPLDYEPPKEDPVSTQKGRLWGFWGQVAWAPTGGVKAKQLLKYLIVFSVSLPHQKSLCSLDNVSLIFQSLASSMLQGLTQHLPEPLQDLARSRCSTAKVEKLNCHQ